MKCDFKYCPDSNPENDGMRLHNEGRKIFLDMEVGESMHLECYVRHVIQKAVDDLIEYHTHTQVSNAGSFHVYEEENSFWLNHEAAHVEINFCPFCGYKPKIK